MPPIMCAAERMAQKVHVFLGDKLLPSAEIRGGKDTAVFRTRLEEAQIPAVLKVWRQDTVLTAKALKVHNNYLALWQLVSNGSLQVVRVPRLYHSFIETQEGILVPLPHDTHVLDSKTSGREIGAIGNQALIVEDLSQGGRFAVADGFQNAPKELKRAIWDDFTVICGLMDGDPAHNLSLLTLSILTADSTPPRVDIGDIDDLKEIRFTCKKIAELREIISAYARIIPAATSSLHPVGPEKN